MIILGSQGLTTIFSLEKAWEKHADLGQCVADYRCRTNILKALRYYNVSLSKYLLGTSITVGLLFVPQSPKSAFSPHAEEPSQPSFASVL
jgi:hypothetical protein